jgi:uncharacterized caspase-like protein
MSAKAGLATDRPLKHAGRDADRVGETLLRMGGLARENLVRVAEPSRADVTRAFERAQRIAQRYAPRDVTLMFYFSGHGDHDALHLNGEVLPLPEVARLMASVPADLRLVITDACRNADLRPKGPSAEPAFAINLTPAPSATGAIWIFASADGEIAQESDELEGAIFTHYWVAGLSGAADLDGDRRVTLQEAYAYAYNQTLFRSSLGRGALQRPEVDSRLKETAPLVLTRLALAGAALRLPQSTDSQYLVYTAFSHAVVGEAWGDGARRVELALAPGRYIVHRRGARTGALDVTLGRGERRDLDAGDFRDVPEQTLAQKGGQLLLAPHSLALGYGVESSGLAVFAQRMRLYYAFEWENFAVGGGLEGSLGHERNDAHDVSVYGLGARLNAEGRFRPWASVELFAALGARGLVLWEELQRRDADVVGRAGYPTARSGSAFGWGPEARVGLRFDRGAPFIFEVAPLGGFLLARRGADLKPLWNGGLELAVGARW